MVTDTHTVAEKIANALAKAIEVQGRTLRVGASLGIAFLNNDESPDQLLLNADQAMYAAKRQGGNQFALHDG